MLGKKESLKVLRQELYATHGVTAVRTTELAQARVCVGVWGGEGEGCVLACAARCLPAAGHAHCWLGA